MRRNTEDIIKVFKNLTNIENPHKYKLEINKEYVGVIDNYTLCVLCRIYGEVIIHIMYDDMLYKLEED